MAECNQILPSKVVMSPNHPILNFEPPLLNSANPWATTKEDLETLYESPFTGAITIRTAQASGFNHDDATHQYCFFEPKYQTLRGHSADAHSLFQDTTPPEPVSSLNTLGYSPLSFQAYIGIIQDLLVKFHQEETPLKPIIFSVAGSPAEVIDHLRHIESLQRDLHRQGIPARLLMEINLSCPNIAGAPPPAYSREEMLKYTTALGLSHYTETIQVGIKTPPYTYQTQFDELISALLETSQRQDEDRCPISFITATNTLGSSLLLSSSSDSLLTPALNSSTGAGIGGLAGSALHPLALGNVATIRRMLDAHERLRTVEIIGVGGVADAAGYERMKAVGAAAVGVGTALGAQGVAVFESIWQKANKGG